MTSSTSWPARRRQERAGGRDLPPEAVRRGQKGRRAALSSITTWPGPLHVSDSCCRIDVVKTSANSSSGIRRFQRGAALNLMEPDAANGAATKCGFAKARRRRRTAASQVSSRLRGRCRRSPMCAHASREPEDLDERHGGGGGHSRHCRPASAAKPQSSIPIWWVRVGSGIVVRGDRWEPSPRPHGAGGWGAALGSVFGQVFCLY